jgi:5-(carboxyamino)imidazole ribonucleotide synthase
MFSNAATRLGYRVFVYAPEQHAPARDTSAGQGPAEFDDEQALTQFGQSVDLVTLEFENVPASAADTIGRVAPLRPAGHVLWQTQDRLREKRFLREHGIACTPFADATSPAQLQAAIAEVGLPGVLKCSAWGYDGKGQTLVRSRDEAVAAHRGIDPPGAIWEGLVDFSCELSVLVARSVQGETRACGPVVNHHERHILDVSVLSRPELATPAVAQAADAAQAIAIATAEALDAVGLICVEFFLTRDGRLLVNEVAPRPHNSGHLTIDACRCSQFEQQVRAVCGLPLGSFELLAPAAAMANLLGDLWQAGEPRWERVLADPQLRLHLYGKIDARPGRKMGHLTALGDTPAQAEQRVRAGRAKLTAPE